MEHEYDVDVVKFKSTLFLNISAASLKLKEFSKAVENATKCIEFEPSNIKAFFRRA